MLQEAQCQAQLLVTHYGCYDSPSLRAFTIVCSKVKTFKENNEKLDENVGTKIPGPRNIQRLDSIDNIMSMTESTCISVESLEDGTFYEDDNDEFVATLSEMSDCHVGQNYSDDELLDEYCRESELRYKNDSGPLMFLIC